MRNSKPLVYHAKEMKLTCIREVAIPDEIGVCDTPSRAAQYWRATVASNPMFNPDVECLAVLFLNTRRKVNGYSIVGIGTLDTILTHPREIYRPAIVAASSAIIMMHNHPSGDPTPSESDIRFTRDIVRAGELLKIELLDHVIVGKDRHSSLREMGYFYK